MADPQLQARRDISVAFYCEYAASDFEEARLSGRQVTDMNALRDEDDILEALEHGRGRLPELRRQQLIQPDKQGQAMHG